MPIQTVWCHVRGKGNGLQKMLSIQCKVQIQHWTPVTFNCMDKNILLYIVFHRRRNIF